MKRKNGEGSWGVKSFKGVQYQYYRDSNGKYTYAKTIKELKLKLKQNNGVVVKSKLCLADYATYYLQNKLLNNIADSTYDRYEDIIKQLKHYSIAYVQINNITDTMCQEYINELAYKYAYNTVKKNWRFLNQVLKSAYNNKDLNKKINDVKLPKSDKCGHPTKQVPFISELDMNILWEESFKTYPGNNKRYYGTAALIIDLIMYTGLRVSEACALTWNNVDIVKNEIKVTSNLTKVRSRDQKGNVLKNKKGNNIYNTTIKSPKSTAGVRNVPLSQRARYIIDLLANEKSQPDDYIFKTAANNPYNKDLVNRTLSRMLNNCNVSRKDYTPHALRHGFGSVLISKGADIKLVSELLGHTDVSFTYNVYIGIFESDKRQAVLLLD